ncbi:hypothetical protein [Pseudomonas caspiana]|uniref:4-hydroxy-4-methyl-2-oxoglutarate aldolase n=1 Tax=Pseudomonas caspiana TaxID=1451454 RepID=A0A1Y3P7M2_9PSED|nr:hypothetical protein [Pseudomonas caspiana]OUM75836.1 hypothetical protein AUC60_01655 [Pseudomonas caspiana]
MWEDGDLLMGDDDGLVCVPFADVEEVYGKAKSKYDAEQAQLQAIAEGTNDRRWVLASLKAKNCPIPGQ